MGLSLDAKLTALRQIIGVASDEALGRLDPLLDGLPGSGIIEIRRVIFAELEDRRFRDAVFAPLAPMFKPRSDGVASSHFRASLLAALWADLKAREPDWVEEARLAAIARNDELSPPQFDTLCHKAAAVLRDAEFCSRLRVDEEAGESLAAFLELSHLARSAVRKLPEWLTKATDERAAAVKLVLKDAAALMPDGAARLFEIALAHISDAHQILRLMALAVDRASDRFLAQSELASFGARLLDDLDVRVKRLEKFDPQGGADAGGRAARDVLVACATLNEFAQTLNLGRDGPWGSRATSARKRMVAAVEARLKDVEPAVNLALPLQTVRIAGRMTRPAPRLNADLDPAAAERARALCALLEHVRLTAAAGGYGALRNQVAEKITERLSVYADEVLHLINSGEIDDPARALAHLELAAQLLAWAKDEQAAQFIRRRAAVAGEPRRSQDVA